MPLYGYTPPEPEYTFDPATGTYVLVKKPVQGQYADTSGAITTYDSEGVMPYMNDGSLKPEFVGQYPGQVGVPDPSHVPAWSGGPQKVNPEKPPAVIAPTTEEALNYGAEIGRLTAAIDTLRERITDGKGDLGAETRKLISYSARLAALVEKAKGTANPALATTPQEAAPVNTNPNNAPPGPPAAPLDTSLLLGPGASNPPATPPNYTAASETNIKYAENMQAAAKREKDKAKRAALLKRAAGYSAKAQGYGAKVTLKPPATSAAPASGTATTTGGTTNA